MIARGLAESECCNHAKAGCIGFGFERDSKGRLAVLPTKGKPCVVGTGTRCAFFEGNVLPIAEQPHPSTIHSALESMVRDYWRGTDGGRRAPKRTRINGDAKKRAKFGGAVGLVAGDANGGEK